LAAFPLFQWGRVYIEGGSHHLIGGSAASSRNLIGGLELRSDHSKVEGNYIGLDASGTIPFDYAGGLAIFGSYNTIGGTSPGRRNVIAGNLLIFGHHHHVQGNYIGTLADGITSVGSFNGGGVAIEPNDIFPTFKNYIGGATPATGNVISRGIFLKGGTTYNVIRNNFVGVGADGATNLDNPGEGIYILNGSKNIIGGIAKINADGGAFYLPAGNTIAFNAGRGVRIDQGSGNLISRNSIYGNGGSRTGGLGIDLAPLGVTPNDDCDTDNGPNKLQNFPIIFSAVSSASSTTINGVMLSREGEYELEFFANSSCGTSNRQGQTFIGSKEVIIIERSCSAQFTATFNTPLGLGIFVTATATSKLQTSKLGTLPGAGWRNNTSEFSQCVTVFGG